MTVKAVKRKDGLKINTEWYIGKFYDPDERVAEASRGKVDDKGNIIVPALSLEECIQKFPECFMEREHIHGNLATSVGIKALVYWMANGAGGGAGMPSAPNPANLFNNANARLVVGTDNTPAAQGDVYTDIANPVYMAMSAGFPNLSAVSPWVLTYQATYGPNDANQSWQEFGLANFDGSGATVLFNHVIANKGVKEVGETYILAMAFTIS